MVPTAPDVHTLCETMYTRLSEWNGTYHLAKGSLKTKARAFKSDTFEFKCLLCHLLTGNLEQVI